AQRHALPRRADRDAPGAPAAFPTRARDAQGAAGRQREGDPDRDSGHRGDEPRAERSDPEQGAAEGSLLPAERVPDQPSSAAPAARGYSVAREPFLERTRAALRSAALAVGEIDEAASGLPLARQRSRAPARDPPRVHPLRLGGRRNRAARAFREPVRPAESARRAAGRPVDPRD